MSKTNLCGTMLGVLLLLMSLAHGGFGWPGVRAELEAAGVKPGSEGWNDAAAGWIFGSVSMGVFGLVIISTVRSMCKGPVHFGPVVAIGLGLLFFGVGACAVIHIGPHFVGFAVIGALCLVWVQFARRIACSRTEGSANPL
jgi:hypothetical protein